MEPTGIHQFMKGKPSWWDLWPDASWAFKKRQCPYKNPMVLGKETKACCFQPSRLWCPIPAAQADKSPGLRTWMYLFREYKATRCLSLQRWAPLSIQLCQSKSFSCSRSGWFSPLSGIFSQSLQKAAERTPSFVHFLEHRYFYTFSFCCWILNPSRHRLLLFIHPLNVWQSAFCSWTCLV